MRYGIALGLLMAAPQSSTEAFQLPSALLNNIWSSPASHRDQRATVPKVASSAFASSDGPSNNATASSLYLASLVTDAVNTDDDAEEIELAERQRKVTERLGSYRVTLPLSSVAQPSSMGMTIRQFSPGPEISDEILNVDTLVIKNIANQLDESLNDGSAETISASVMQERLDPEFAGLYVSSVAVQSSAWKAGIRPGDLLISTAATFGGALWPKSTLEGVRSALTSRRMTTDSATFEFKRTDVEKARNVYELTLSKPIGLNLRGEFYSGGFGNAVHILTLKLNLKFFHHQ